MDRPLPLLTIRLLGQTFVQSRTGDLRLSNYEHAVLALLASDQGRWVNRATVVETIWPVKETEKGRASLSQVIYKLRKRLPDGVVQATPDQLLLDANLASVDYAAFMTDLRQGLLDKAIDLYRGPFLADFPYISDAFDDWRTAKAALVDRLTKDACEKQFQQLALSDDYKRAAIVCAVGMRIPTSTDAFARLRVEALALDGDLAAARYELGRLLAQGETGADLAALQDQLACVEASNATPGSEFFLPIVGRTSETQTVLRLWDESQAGCRVVTVTGDAGIGKSSFLRQISKRLVLRGARCFHHKCVEFESTLSYTGLIGTIQNGVRPGDLEVVEQEWIPPLLALAPEAFDAIPPMTMQQGATAHRRIREAVAQYFLAVAGSRPILIAVDDFHLLDEPSREVFVYLTKRLRNSPVLLLLTGKVREMVSVTLEDDTSLVYPIHLTQLQQGDINRLIDAFCSRYSYVLSNATRSELRAYSCGHPLLLVEILRHASINRLTGDRLELPSTIQGHVQNQIAGLNDRARPLLWAAATLTHGASLDFLAHMTGLSPAEASTAAAELIRAGLLEQKDTLTFRHDLIRDAARKCVPLYERRLWHRRAAETTQSLQHNDAHTIAVHFEAAGEMRLAYRYSKRAAASAMVEHGRPEDAETHILRMLRCAPARLRRVPLQMLLEHYSAHDQYHKLEPFAPELTSVDSGDPHSEVLSAMVAFHIRQRSTGIGDLALEAKAILAEASTRAPALLPRVLWQVGDYIQQSGEHALMKEFATIMQAMSRDAPPSSAADMLSLAALMIGSTDGFESALPVAHGAMNFAVNTADQVSQAHAAFALGTVSIWAGHVNSARDHYQSALTGAETSGLGSIMRAAIANLAVVLMEQGKLDDAQELALKSLHDVGYLRRAYSYGNLALIHLKMNDVNSARHYATAMAECNRLSPQPWIPVHVEAILGTSDLIEGNDKLAAKRARAISDQAIQAPVIGDQAHIHIYIARATVASRGPEIAKRLADRAKLTLPRDYIGGARMMLAAESLARSMNFSFVSRATIASYEEHALQSGAVLLAQESQLLLL